MPRSDDITPLLVPPGEPPLGYRQGIILSWDPFSGANQVQIGTETFEDLQTVSANGNVILLAGDVVAVLRINNRYVILGRIATNDHQRMNFVSGGLMGPADTQTALWPGTTASSDTDLWAGWVNRGGDNIVMYCRTSVAASTTAVFTFWVGGHQVADSGTYSFGIGNFSVGALFPTDLAYNTVGICTLKARVTSGTGKAAASVQGLWMY